MSPESINQPEKVQKSPFGNQFGSLEESDNFPGTKIISFDIDGKIQRYALSRDVSGNLQGSEFELQEYQIMPSTGGDGFWKNSGSMIKAQKEDGAKYRVGPTYQMHQDSLDGMQKYLDDKGITI